MRRINWVLGGGICLMLAGCGPSQAGSKTPEQASAPPPQESTIDEIEQDNLPPPESEQSEVAMEERTEQSGTEPEQAAAEPEFREGMSVNEAIDAVPRSSDRINIEPEALAKPLQDPELYKPCKPKPHEHFKIRVAIWQGKAVGLDVSTTPKNAALEECLKQQINQITWEEAVPSLNTVGYQF